MKKEIQEMTRAKQDKSNGSASEWKSKAREAGVAAWDATRAAGHQFQEKAISYSKATDHAIRQRPYVLMGIAFGAGLLIGLLAVAKNRSKENSI
jgi:ElaB/YqjD/DUF883 family membrane-anchored ribosome-binding protein